jgi:hypothetical protein
MISNQRIFNQKTISGFWFILSLLFSSQSQALKFSYDNYSKIPNLEYSFTFNGIDWFQHESKHDGSLVLNPKEFKTIEFKPSIPLAWKVEDITGGEIHCWDYYDKNKKEVKNIITLNEKKFTKNNDLLLDIIDAGQNNILVSIIDMDGNQAYSNTLICSFN